MLVGVTGLQLSRADFYEKELSFQVSCSYGPGRYDPNYEVKGQDYPLGFVRWTEQRNFEAFLQLLADGQVNVKPLISHRFDFKEALKAYDLVGSGDALGVILNYSRSATDSGLKEPGVRSVQTVDLTTYGAAKGASVCVGYIGAGGFSGQVLLPALSKTPARLKAIVSSKGVTGTHLGQKFGFEKSSTDVASIMTDPDINTVLITTRHNSHAKFVKQALNAGKRVYVEKPLCLTPAELIEIVELYSSQQDSGKSPFLMVGFNRRFAPQVMKMKSLLNGMTEPKAMILTVNAGYISVDHWTQDPTVGGGRIIGEGCHFIDLLRYLADSPIVSVDSSVCELPDTNACRDTVTISLKFADGSVGSIHYFANGHKNVAKERFEIFSGRRVLQLDNFRRLVGHGWEGFSKMNLWNQDKGHRAEMETLVAAIADGRSCPIPFDEIEEVTRASFVATGAISEM